MQIIKKEPFKFDNALSVIYVTYSPNEIFYQNIKKLLNHRLEVHVFCNCSISKETLESKFSNNNNLNIYSSGKNLGLPRAYNFLIKELLNLNKKHALIFDQDMVIDEIFFKKFNEIYSELFNLTDYLAIQIESKNGSIQSIKKDQNKKKLVKKKFIINSGSFIYLSNVKKVGFYPEDFFIDGVDYWMCMKSKNFGLNIGIYHGDFGLDHLIGQEDKFFNIFGKKIYYRKYSRIRIKDFFSSHYKLIKISIYQKDFLSFFFLCRSISSFILRNMLGRVFK